MGFFSWRCSKSKKPIANVYSPIGSVPCVMVTPFGNFEEYAYEGYGIIGGVDAYVMLALMNDPKIKNRDDLDKVLEMLSMSNEEFENYRSLGIKMAFSKEKPKGFRPLKIVALYEYAGESYEQLLPSEDDDHQGFAFDDEEIEEMLKWIEEGEKKLKMKRFV